MSNNKSKWSHYNKKHAPIEALEKVEQKDAPPQAVLFVQFTENGELASRIREVIQKLKPWTGINLKVIERVGEKLEDIIHKSNPWENSDCKREDCFTCLSSSKCDEPNYKNCQKRSVVYQTWCQTCLDSRKLANLNRNESEVGLSSELNVNTNQVNTIEGFPVTVNESKLVGGELCETNVNLIHPIENQVNTIERSPETVNDSKLVSELCENNVSGVQLNSNVTGGPRTEVNEVSHGARTTKNEVNFVNSTQISKKRCLEKIENGPLFMYIGETSRSAYERGQEHQKDFQFKRAKSHYLRHAVECHPSVDPKDLKFCMKILF